MTVSSVVRPTQQQLPAPLLHESPLERNREVASSETEQNPGIPAQLPLRDLFRNLQDGFLQLERFKNDGELILPGRPVLKIDTDFINPKGTLLTAIQGISIKSGLYRNRGVILSPKGSAAIVTGDFNNKEGYVECAGPLEVKAQTADNRKGTILTASAAEVAVYGKYDQTQGALSGHQGVNGQFGTFINAEKGKVLSKDGLVKIVTTDDLTQDGIIQGAKGIILTSHQGLWSENGLLLTPNEKLLIQFKDLLWKDVEGVAKELELKGELAECTEVHIDTQGQQIIEVDTAEFLRVFLRAQDGDIQLLTPESGSYEECALFSGGASITYQSDGLLYFQNTSNLAKKEIEQNALHLIDHESSHVAEERVLQFADVLDSDHSLLSSKDTVCIDVRVANSTGLAVIAEEFQGDCVEEGQFSHARVRVGNQAAWTSQTKYIDLSDAELTCGKVDVHTLQQIFLQRAKVQLKDNAKFVSEEGWINAHAASFEKGEVFFEAPQGTIYLNEVEMQSVQKLTAKGA